MTISFGRILRPVFGATELGLIAACSRKAPPPPPMRQGNVAVPLHRDVTDRDEYVGRFEAIKDVGLRPRGSGTIERIVFARAFGGGLEDAPAPVRREPVVQP